MSSNNSFIANFPELFAEWDFDKNTNLNPNELTSGSNKKVWWRCEKNHSWLSSIHNRTKGRKCPYCSGRVAWPGESDIATLFPGIASQWHPNKNGNVSPMSVRPGCNTLYWWKCDMGHEWQDSPNHRTKGRGCPYCSHKRVSPSNSLGVKYPTIAEEWDYSVNKGSPMDYFAFSNEEMTWICKKCGYKWNATIANRTKAKSGCPLCSNQVVVSGKNDLATLNPFLASEWDNDLNVLAPTQVCPGSPALAWWKCAYGHSWQARINNRNRGIGCPICSKSTKESLQEYIVYYYVHVYFADAKHSYKSDFLGKSELDIYIPSIKTGVEYDGWVWHKDKNRDIRKDTLCSNNGIRLIRIREPKCIDYKRNDPTIILQDLTIDSLQDAIMQLLRFLGSSGKAISLSNEYSLIFESYRSTASSNNLLQVYPELAKEWSASLNGQLRPENIPAYRSKQQFYWHCSKCNSDWRASLDSRIEGSGCPVCSGKIVKSGYNDLRTVNPHLAEEWDMERNGQLFPDTVFGVSKKKVWWKCKNGHEWRAAICDRARGTGCPFCSGKKVFKGFNDLESNNPDLAKEWHPYKNNSLFPSMVTSNSGKKVWWLGKCGHEWQATVYSRNSGSGCPLCARNRRKDREEHE